MATKFALWLIPLLFLGSAAASAQDQEHANEVRSITGCLRQGIESGGYYLDSHDGKMWELRGNVDKNAMGREVSVEGHERQFPMKLQTEIVPDEKQESNGRPYRGFEVSRTKTVANSCR